MLVVFELVDIELDTLEEVVLFKLTVVLLKIVEVFVLASDCVELKVAVLLYLKDSLVVLKLPVRVSVPLLLWLVVVVFTVAIVEVILINSWQ